MRSIDAPPFSALRASLMFFRSLPVGGKPALPKWPFRHPPTIALLLLSSCSVCPYIPLATCR